MRLVLATLLLGAGGSSAAELPRLTGTLVGPGERTALFAIGPSGTVPATIGDRIGDYVVSGIEPGRVDLDEAGRHVVVSLEAAGSAPAARAAGATFGLILRQPGPADD